MGLEREDWRTFRADRLTLRADRLTFRAVQRPPVRPSRAADGDLAAYLRAQLANVLWPAPGWVLMQAPVAIVSRWVAERDEMVATSSLSAVVSVAARSAVATAAVRATVRSQRPTA